MIRAPLLYRTKLASGLLLTFALAACSVATPPRVTLATHSVRLPPTVKLDLNGSEGQPISPQLDSFAAKFAAALARHGVQQSPQSTYKLAIALSLRSANLGLAREADGKVCSSSEYLRQLAA